MGSIYYYSRDGQVTGPVSSRDIRRLAAVGKLRPADLVWKEGYPEWIAASRVKGLQWPARRPSNAATSQEAFDDVEIVQDKKQLLSEGEFRLSEEEEGNHRDQ